MHSTFVTTVLCEYMMTIAHTFSIANPITSILLRGERNLENLEEIRADTGRSYQAGLAIGPGS